MDGASGSGGALTFPDGRDEFAAFQGEDDEGDACGGAEDECDDGGFDAEFAAGEDVRAFDGGLDETFSGFVAGDDA